MFFYYKSKDIQQNVAYLFIRFFKNVGYVAILLILLVSFLKNNNRMLWQEEEKMKKIASYICKHKIGILVISFVLSILSLIGMKLTTINYDILVYLPEEIETVQGQEILTNDFGMGAYTIVMVEDMSSKELLKLEEEFTHVDGVSKVISIYDLLGTTIPLEMFPSEISSKFHQELHHFYFYLILVLLFFTIWEPISF